VILVPFEHIVGENRFAVGLIDPAKGMIHDAAVHFGYFDLSDPTKPKLESEADAVRLQTPDGTKRSLLRKGLSIAPAIAARRSRLTSPMVPPQ
jgi:hypothetical protein